MIYYFLVFEPEVYAKRDLLTSPTNIIVITNIWIYVSEGFKCLVLATHVFIIHEKQLLKQKYVFLVNLTKQWYALEEITHAESNFNLFI